MRTRNRLFAGVAAAALTAWMATPEARAVTWTYSDWDEDGNLELTETEFRTGIEESGIYAIVDVDQDQQIDEDEFADWARGENAGIFYENADFFDEWDEDASGWLSEDEFYGGAWGAADVDDDDYLTEDEFAAFGADWAGEETAVGTTALEGGEIVSLDEWAYDDLYAGGWSAEDFIDEMEVYGVTGEEIGEVEDIIVNADGKVISVVAEVGGFWDIGDTHVSVPWDEVSLAEDAGGVILPVTEENIEDYGYYEYSGLAGSPLGEQVATGVDDLEAGYRTWRVSELIGDYARLRDGDQFVDYGYINDVIIKDGRIAATVVEADTAYGGGYRAYPYYGYDYGWEPGAEYYDMPYGEDEVGAVDEFEYDQVGYRGLE